MMPLWYLEDDNQARDAESIYSFSHRQRFGLQTLEEDFTRTAIIVFMNRFLAYFE